MGNTGLGKVVLGSYQYDIWLHLIQCNTPFLWNMLGDECLAAFHNTRTRIKYQCIDLNRWIVNKHSFLTI